MKLATPQQMRAIDSCAINEYGIPGILLMENAASAVAAKAVSMLGGCKGKRVLVLAGGGNNGGDAFAAARLLYCKGAGVCVYLTGAKGKISGDALTNLNILEKIGLQVNEINDENDIGRLRADMKEPDMILDGIFGTGLGRDVEGIAAAVINEANTSGKPILSIDIPSGIDGTTGRIRGTCIKAAATVTFGLVKTGLAVHPGCECAGRLTVADIGIPESVMERQPINVELIEAGDAARLLPVRKAEADSSKANYGRALLITGSPGMTGSGCLASMAALRSGAGLVYTGVPGSLSHIYGAALTEPVVIPLEDGGSGFLAAESVGWILDNMGRMDVVAIGPGLTACEGVKGVVNKLICKSKVPLVLDADALNVLSGNAGVLKKSGVDIVITPHPGEMSRLTGIETGRIQEDRLETACRFAMEYKVTVVLKGSRTVVALPDGRAFVNPTGNAGMATAGAGDVLTGIIAGLMAQGVGAGDAAVAGVYLHGLAGDMSALSSGLHSLTAGDLIDHLPGAFKELIRD